jgi:hypothetical protein
LKAATGLGRLGQVYLGKNVAELVDADTVTFHAVGDEEPKSHRLVELERIVLG